MSSAKKTLVNIPQLTSIETAIDLYYSRLELSNSDIVRLFGSIGAETIIRLKDAAKETMNDEGIYLLNPRYVNTTCAYKAWGIDITDLERRLIRLQELNLRPTTPPKGKR